MRKGPAIVLLLGLLGTGVVLAAGFGGGDAPPARIPIPAHVYSARVEDQSGVTVDVTEVSYNGEIFLYGTLGEGQVTVPFDNIREVRFEPTDDTTKRVAFVMLKDGATQRIVVDGDVLAYGRTSFGTYSIPIDRLRRIEITGKAP